MHVMMMLIVKFLLMMMRMSLATTAGLMRAKAGLEASSGTVDDATEIFGSTNVDGFNVLERLDSNADGKIDANDEKFAELKVWQDTNGNGVVDAGELKTLT